MSTDVLTTTQPRAIRVVILTTTDAKGKERYEKTCKHLDETVGLTKFTTRAKPRNDENPVVGCFTAHTEAAKESHRLWMESKIHSTIFEDDVRVVSAEAWRVWTECIVPFACENPNIDFILGGMSAANPIPANSIPVPGAPEYRLTKVGGGSGFFGYSAVSDKGYAALADEYNCTQKNTHIDVTFIRGRNRSPKTISIYCITPFVFTTAQGHSVIRNQDVNHTYHILRTQKTIITRLQRANVIKSNI